MTATAHPRPGALGILAIEERDAWTEYLETTRCDGYRYDEVEPWAWSRLRARLRAVEARRGALAS